MTVAVGVSTICQPLAELLAERLLDALSNILGSVANVDHVASSQSPELPRPYVHGREIEGWRLDQATARISNERSRNPQEAEVTPGAKSWHDAYPVPVAIRFEARGHLLSARVRIRVGEHGLNGQSVKRFEQIAH